MNDISELWISPWRKMQESLALEFGAEPARGPAAEVAPAANGALVATGSWLVRARSREVRIQSSYSRGNIETTQIRRAALEQSRFRTRQSDE
jgi:hypothetical protein